MSASSEPNPPDPLIGTVVADRYRILEAIARGGMGRIYKAEQVGLGRMVALKVLDDRTSDPEGFRKRFTLEASTSAKLSHPNIVVVHDYGSFELEGARRYFMAMELIDGPTLAGLLKREGGRLPVGRAAFIAREIARALRDAHKQGVVHRDLKPSNVMLVEGADGEHVKVLDFGIAKVLQTGAEDEPEEQLTHEGVLVGTPRYMAPEQLTGGAVDPRTDLYSLGVVLYQMISGRTPHMARDHMQAVVAHMQAPTPELPDEVLGEVPTALRDVIRTCMQKLPIDRFPDATAFLRALDAASVGLAGWAGPTASGELRRSLGGLGSPDDPSYPSTGSGMRMLGGTGAGQQTPAPVPAAPVGDAPTRVDRPDRTPAPVAPATVEQVSGARGGRAASVATIGVLFALLVGAIAWGLGRSPDPTTPAVPPPSTSTTATSTTATSTTATSTTATSTTTPEAPPEDVIPAPPARFHLTIASTPLGATVTEAESGHPVGLTPLTLELETEALRAAPRAYRVELAGHAPHLFVQGASEHDVNVMATLVALPTPARPSRPSRPRTSEGTSIAPPEDRMLKTSR